MKNVRGKKYILTVECSFSRYFFAIPCSQDRAIDAAAALVKEVVLRFNFIPKIISSDRGTHFTGKVFSEMCEKLGIKQELHTAWHPESSGNIERAHRTLKNSIYALCAEQNYDWVTALPYCVNAMNLAKNSATGCAPYFCVFGRKPCFGWPTLGENGVKSTTALGYGANVREVLDRIHYLVQLSAEEADKAMENRLNKGRPPERLFVGDEVYIKRDQSAVAKATNLPWVGTYRILDTNQRVIKVSDNNGNSDWIHRNHVIKRVERKPDLTMPGANDLPPPSALNSADFARVSIGSSNNDSGGRNMTPRIAQPTLTNNEDPNTSLRPRRWSTRTRTAPDRYNPSLNTVKKK